MRKMIQRKDLTALKFVYTQQRCGIIGEAVFIDITLCV